MKYTQYEFFTKDELQRDWLVSILSDNHFEGFEETNDSLKAFVPSEQITQVKVRELLYDNDFTEIEFECHDIEEKNWNEEWEKNFDPVTIAMRVGIRAPFHKELGTEYELVIEPKMSFGTGHHSTTALVIELMLKEDFSGKSVLDFGSGTGVLAILAEKLKAAKIVAIDNEQWAYENCVENAERNGSVNIACIHGDDTHTFNEQFDVVLANINRHVILKNIATWSSYVKQAGLMIVSGILQADEKDVVAEAEKTGLKKKEVLHHEGWIAIAFTKN